MNKLNMFNIRQQRLWSKVLMICMSIASVGVSVV